MVDSLPTKFVIDREMVPETEKTLFVDERRGGGWGITCYDTQSELKKEQLITN